MTRRKKIKILLSFVITSLFLLILLIISMKTGSVQLSFSRILKGLFIEYDKDVAIIYDLRFPRILVSVLSGAALAVSGTLLQSVMKNPMTDPGIIGISSAASLVSSIVLLFLPQLYFISPILSILGGMFAYFLIYTLAWDGGVRPVRLILVGIALNMSFIGMNNALSSMTGGNLTQVQSIIEGNVSQKTWSDVNLLGVYVGIFLIVSLFTVKTCNLLTLEDKTAQSLGVNVNRSRLIVSFIAIILASITTAVVGVIGFLALLVPHIGRLLVTGDHKYLIPYSALLGSTILLLSDTVGRVIAYPFEIQASVIMSIVGGPFFIILLKLGGKDYGN